MIREEMDKGKLDWKIMGYAEPEPEEQIDEILWEVEDMVDFLEQKKKKYIIIIPMKNYQFWKYTPTYPAINALGMHIDTKEVREIQEEIEENVFDLVITTEEISKETRNWGIQENETLMDIIDVKRYILQKKARNHKEKMRINRLLARQHKQFIEEINPSILRRRIIQLMEETEDVPFLQKTVEEKRVKGFEQDLEEVKQMIRENQEKELFMIPELLKYRQYKIKEISNKIRQMRERLIILKGGRIEKPNQIKKGYQEPNKIKKRITETKEIKNIAKPINPISGKVPIIMRPEKEYILEIKAKGQKPQHYKDSLKEYFSEMEIRKIDILLLKGNVMIIVEDEEEHKEAFKNYYKKPELLKPRIQNFHTTSPNSKGMVKKT